MTKLIELKDSTGKLIFWCEGTLADAVRGAVQWNCMLDDVCLHGAKWVTHLAGEAGAALERQVETSATAALIYMRSDPSLQTIPNFYASNEDALAALKRLADQEAKAEGDQS
jgi:hypothetical protein